MNGTTTPLRRAVGAGNVGQEPLPVATLVVYKDDAGYGMKVSGDNPVYVQSVKEGGAAARAGLVAGDRILKVNGVNVMQSVHTDVVELIKSSTQVVLTVQPDPVLATLTNHPVRSTGIHEGQPRPTSLTPSGSMVSPSQSATSLHRAATAPAGGAPCSTRITGPQPVDHEKKRQMDAQRVNTFQLMLEKEQSYVDKLRSDLAKAGVNSGNASNIINLQSELAGAERRVRKLQEELIAMAPNDQPCSLVTNASSPSGHYPGTVAGGVTGQPSDVPPPLPSRKSLPIQCLSPPPLPPRPPSTSNTHNIMQSGTLETERYLMTHLTAPTTSYSIPNSFSQDARMSSPTGLSKHQRTKSSPEQLGTSISPSEASRRLIASESMNDLSPFRHTRHSGIDVDDPIRITPPGTPPPPYPQPHQNADLLSSTLNDSSVNESFPAASPPRQSSTDSPGLPTIQQPIMSMEDDDMSDQEVGQLEDHGPFKSLSRLWEHHAHLSVFINYVLSNSDPSGLLFYLVTDLYKEGNAKEMKKWAYEIHSSFLVPGAPLRLNNVDENIAREIDDVLLKESDKEEILRKIFWKARAKAKEELNEQLADFQQKRTAGLGMLFGPSDIILDESESDKSKETKIIETFLLPKMEGYLEDIEKDQGDLRQFTTAAGLATILTKIFQVRCVSLDRVPIFVAKDKSNIKARLLTAKNRKMTVRGHHFAAHQYFTVTYCNHCQLIIGGIGPQGYQCTDCSLSVHRPCVRVVEENCPGPVVRKERANDALSKLMERIYRPERKPPSSHHYHQNQLHLVERAKRAEEEGALIDGENGEHRGVASGNTRSSAERGRLFGFNDHPDNMDDPFPREDISEMVQQNISSKPKTSNINRSESYKERIHNKDNTWGLFQRQLREKRKTSDPNLSKTNDCEASGAFPGNSAGSSSNSSLSTRSLDSRSTSLEQVHSTAPGNNNTSSWDSDVDVEPDPPDWSQGVSEEALSRLSNSEKKRQEVINELFHTERSHVRALKVLSYVFHKPLQEHQVLPVDQIDLLFSNLDEMVTIHSRFNQAMKRKKKENPCVGDVGDLILDMFDGENGETFEQAASTYCAKQQVALDNLRDRRRKDQKLNSFLSDIESNPMCRRLQLKDHIVTGMLRLTKYPLLFENLAKYTPETNERERAAVLRGLERSKEILSLVNQAVREAEDCQRLTEILRMIDRSAFDKFDHPTVQEFKNLDITKRTLIHEGPLQWRIVNRPKPVDLHVVLLDDTILLLHRQDEKYLLKFMNTNQVNSVLSPIVKVSTVLVRNNAVDKNSLYLVNTSQKGAQIYDLVAASSAECKLWCKHISEAADAYNKARSREGRRPSSPQASLNNSNEEAPEGSPEKVENDSDQQLEKDKAGDKGNDGEQYLLGDNRDSSSSVNNLGDCGKESEGSEANTSPSTPGETPGGPETAGNNPCESSNTAIGETMRLVTCTQCSLIDPTEVHAEVRPIHVAEPVLTPIERLRRKDQVIREALIEKQALVADILNIPKEDFEHVADMADMASEQRALEKEPAEVILVAINQANQLISLINMALVVTESEAVLAAKGSSGAAGGCGTVGCPVPRNTGDSLQPSIPVSALQPVCHSLNMQLSQLLEIVKEREGERERLRKELRRSRERLHAFDVDAQKRAPPQSDPNTSQSSIESPPCTLSAEGGHNDSAKDEFVDANEDSLQTKSDETKDTVKTQVMGDCVG
ncbi:rho guanine nucleotide exchange factor 12 isoform X4 [Diachasmimorpha longicaudata]|uniref:rho guanine nucleotide exchange factor 12 isoform X4 n=1 Tax=Diachasmimorpha longicaudata TaxID=58733 RepID=UPI0030B8F6A0